MLRSKRAASSAANFCCRLFAFSLPLPRIRNSPDAGFLFSITTMKETEEVREAVLHPKCFTFVGSWWTLMQKLPREQQATLCLTIVDYVFNHQSPDLQEEPLASIWATIGKDISRKQRESYNRKMRTSALEKEKPKEKEAPLSELTPIEKEIQKEKERRAQEFYLKLQTVYPNVAAMEVSLSFDEYLKLLMKWPLSLIRKILAQMNNWKDLQTHISAYKTCNQWLQGEKKTLVDQRRWDKFEVIVDAQQKAVAKYLPKK